MNKTLHFIVNPRAGRGRATRTWESIRNVLDSLQIELGQKLSITYNFVTEDYAYHELSKDTVLVAVGGDGSIHHTGKLALQHGLALGVIPAGTGNDYAATLGISESLRDALITLLNGKPAFIDVFRVNDDLILNVGGFGIDAAVVHFIEANGWVKRMGSLGYGIAMPTVLRRYRPYDLTITIDGVSECFHNVSLCAVANGTRFGGGMLVAPSANSFDGKIDVCVASGLRKMELLRLFPSIYRGQHVGHPKVEIRCGEHVQIEFGDDIPPSEFDGEPIVSSRTVDIQVLHQQMRVVLPNKQVN